MRRKNPAKTVDSGKFYQKRRLIGEMLRGYRVSRRLTQAEMADASGLHPTFISQLENGSTTIALDRIFPVCEAYGIGEDVDALVMVILRAIYPEVLWISFRLAEIALMKELTNDELFYKALRQVSKKSNVVLEAVEMYD